MLTLVAPGVIHGMDVEHLSTAEAAAALGWTASRVRRATQSGELQSVSVGGNIRIPREAVEAKATNAVRATAEDHALIETLFGEPLSSLPLLVDAEWLAPRMKMHPRAVRDAIRRGDIPSVKFGNRRRVPIAALVRWLNGKAA